MKNNKGFSLVELLAVIAILGILFGLGIQAYSTYKEKAKKQGYDTMAKSATEAMEEYKMDHPSASSMNFDTLYNSGYLSSIADPGDKGNSCTGTVTVSTIEGTAARELDQNEYVVSICCTNYNYTYSFPSGNKLQNKNGCQAEANVDNLIETNSANCAEGNTKTVKKGIYTMDYIDKICTKGSNGRYGGCYDANTPGGDPNLPCRRYKYNHAVCACTYSKTSNKFCSSSVVSTDHHTMRIKYLENSDGHAACESDDPSYFNSYVDHVCWQGQFKNGATEISFHGYKFYRGKSTAYTDFRPDGSWFHDGGNFENRVVRKSDAGTPNAEDGCQRTCIQMTETYSGAVH